MRVVAVDTLHLGTLGGLIGIGDVVVRLHLAAGDEEGHDIAPDRAAHGAAVMTGKACVLVLLDPQTAELRGMWLVAGGTLNLSPSWGLRDIGLMEAGFERGLVIC